NNQLGTSAKNANCVDTLYHIRGNEDLMDRGHQQQLVDHGERRFEEEDNENRRHFFEPPEVDASE
ncbi:Hypothetical predicted protein, partial [Podarcis lilfordi]